MQIKWEWKVFNKLSLHELYEILKLRSSVFVVEQKCPFLDLDGLDVDALHLVGTASDDIDQTTKVVAYLRSLSDKKSAKLASFGRVAIDQKYRGKGLGSILVDKEIERMERIGIHEITIDAQCYLEKFYRSKGFISTSEPFLEDNIQHIRMVRSSTNFPPRIRSI